MIGIYKITNNVNGKIYVGQSVNIEKRWKDHISASKNKNYYNHKKSLLYPAMKKYGINNFSFEVIEECSIFELDEKEIKWIKYYDSNNFKKGYNILSGGYQGHQFNPTIFYELWDEGKTVKEIAEITNASYSTIENNLKNYKNYSTSESLSRSSVKSDYHQTLIDKTPVYQYDLLGNYITEYESINHASFILFGDYQHKSIWQAINSENHMAYNYLWSNIKVDKMPMYLPNNRKAVQCIETGEIFSSTREAARAYNMKSPSSIIACCKGKQKSAAKDLITNEPLHWKYYSN